MGTRTSVQEQGFGRSLQVMVSIIMPVFNGKPYLAGSVESIISQKFEDWEMIVIDDGSTDGSGDLVASYDHPQISIVRNERNLGIVASLNRGLSLAKGDLIARQDADDVSHPQRLDLQVRFLRDNPDVVLVGSQARMIDGEGNYCGFVERSREQEGIRWGLMFGNEFTHTSVMFRSGIVRTFFEGYRSYFCCEDYDLWSRIAEEYCVANLPVPLVDSRVNLSSVTHRDALTKRDQVDVWRREILKRNLSGLAIGISDSEIALISCFSFEIPTTSIRQFIDLLEKLLKQYLKVNPEAAKSADLRRTVARQYKRLFVTSLKVSPSQALRIFYVCVFRYPLATLNLVSRRLNAGW